MKVTFCSFELGSGFKIWGHVRLNNISSRNLAEINTELLRRISAHEQFASSLVSTSRSRGTNIGLSIYQTLQASVIQKQNINQFLGWNIGTVYLQTVRYTQCPQHN
jgi:hypothetical protein